MKRIIATLLTLGIVALPAQSQHRNADEAAIRRIDTEWSAALGKKDLQTVTAVYADDAVFLAPNQPIVEGKDAIGAWFKARFETPGYDASFLPTKIVVSRAGDMAWEIGTFKARYTREDGATLQSVGKHLVTWEKRDGAWVVAAESISGDAREPTVVLK